MASKYWKDMFISDNISDANSTNDNETKDSYIISKDKPVLYQENKNITIDYIKPEEYQEVSKFVCEYNKMSTGNITLFTVNDIHRYLKLPNTSLVMKSTSGKIMGTIFSLELPIKVGQNNGNNKDNNQDNGNKNNKDQIIIHGCTTFLNVHNIVRGYGLCMALIRDLIFRGYKKQIFCDYHMVSMKIGDNAFKINSWYRPINLKSCVKIGFLYPDWDNPSIKNRRLAMRYNTKLLPNISFILIDHNNLSISLEYYLSQVGNKKFVFYPDKDLWNMWISSFPTYLIYYNNELAGLLSTNNLSCYIEVTKQHGKLLFPTLCVGDVEKVLSVLLYLASQNNYDAVYMYQSGYITSTHLENIKAIKTDNDVWFSLYNNRVSLTPGDLMVPLL